MRKTKAVITLAALAVLVLPQPASRAASGAETSANCTFLFTERFSPGFTLAASSGNQDSAAESGTVHCSGTVNGQRLTGPGTFWNSGRYTDSTCLIDSAAGRYFLTAQTDTGTVQMDGSFAVERLGTLLKVTTESPTLRGEGSALVIPTKGECVFTPITEAFAVMSLTFKGTEAAGKSCGLDAVVLQLNCSTRS